jgi:2,3-bisphosphoglycerate-dependent phosphoglycerate mutase
MTARPDARRESASLILLRHGESVWNREGRFTGWMDVGLTDRGIAQAQRAGTLLTEHGVQLDTCHTSVLKRAIKTLWIVLETLDRMWLPVQKTWRLNERHYGALQGLSKVEVGVALGEAQVHLWRRGFADRPPPLDEKDERFPGRDPRYAGVDPAQLPRAESLKDTMERVLPYWHGTLAPELRAGHQPLICAHGNSLRALIKHLDHIADDAIPAVEIPTGTPLVYELDQHLEPVRRFYLAHAPGAAGPGGEATAEVD